MGRDLVKLTLQTGCCQGSYIKTNMMYLAVAGMLTCRPHNPTFIMLGLAVVLSLAFARVWINCAVCHESWGVEMPWPADFCAIQNRYGGVSDTH
jgi:hypothetical protein